MRSQKQGGMLSLHVARPNVCRQHDCRTGSGKEGCGVRPLYFSLFTDGVPLGNS